MPVILHRRGTAAQWTSANTILGAGEFGVETDTLLFKIGNGSTAWTSLSYGAITTASGDTRYVLASSKGAANGVVPLNGSGKIDSTYLGSLRIANVATVSNQSARLALPQDDDAQFIVQSDTSETYMLAGGSDPSVNGNWIKLPTPNMSGYQATSEKNQANGYAGLDSSTKLLASQLPTIDGGTP